MTPNGPLLSRRLLLGLAMCAPAALGASGAVAADKVCIDQDALSDGELSLRAAVKFQEKAPDPAKVCAGCAFFEPAANAPGCGTCKLLHGPVLPTSVCTSWAKK